MQVAGAVLAGGTSSRMGRTKSLVEVGGTPMGRIVADALGRGGCAPVAFVGGDPNELLPLLSEPLLSEPLLSEPLICELVADRYPGEGPLGGVLTALRHFEGASHVLVAACDLPMLDAHAVRSMLDAAARAPDAAAVVANSGRREPGLVVWNRAAMSDIIDAFDGGMRAVHRLLERVGAVDQPVDIAVMRNVNRPGDVPGSANDGAAGQ